MALMTADTMFDNTASYRYQNLQYEVLNLITLHLGARQQTAFYRAAGKKKIVSYHCDRTQHSLTPRSCIKQDPREKIIIPCKYTAAY